jgi:hypothetical protein
VHNLRIEAAQILGFSEHHQKSGEGSNRALWRCIDQNQTDKWNVLFIIKHCLEWRIFL